MRVSGPHKAALLRGYHAPGRPKGYPETDISAARSGARICGFQADFLGLRLVGLGRLGVGLALIWEWGFGGVLSIRRRFSSSDSRGGSFAMNDDLLEARAVLEWAEADLPSLARRVAGWVNDTPCRIFRDVNSHPSKHLFRLCDVKPVPLILCAHAGMIIHGIRSSLDLLAVALAERNSHPSPEDVYFPIAQSESSFGSKNGGLKKIQGLTAEDVKIIESLKPWKGGHHLLFELHDLDKKRKHRHLLSAYVAPSAIIADGRLNAGGLRFISAWPSFKEDAVIAEIPAYAPQGDILLSVEIRLAEPGRVSTHGVITALNEFITSAKLIISLFDKP